MRNFHQILIDIHAPLAIAGILQPELHPFLRRFATLVHSSHKGYIGHYARCSGFKRFHYQTWSLTITGIVSYRKSRYRQTDGKVSVWSSHGYFSTGEFGAVSLCNQQHHH